MSKYKENANRLHFHLSNIFSDVEVSDTRHDIVFSGKTPRQNNLNPKLEFKIKVNKNSLYKTTEKISYQYLIDPRKDDICINMTDSFDSIEETIINIIKGKRLDQAYLESIKANEKLEKINEDKKTEVLNLPTTVSECLNIKERTLNINKEAILSIFEKKGLDVSFYSLSHINTHNQTNYLITENKTKKEFYDPKHPTKELEISLRVKKDGHINIPALLLVETELRQIPNVTDVLSSHFSGVVTAFIDLDNINEVK